MTGKPRWKEKKSAAAIFFIIQFCFFLCLPLDSQISRNRIKRPPSNSSKKVLQEKYQAAFDWPQSTPEVQGLNSQIFEKAVAHVKNLGFVDSLLVVRNGYLIVEEYFNGFDRNTPHKIASASKTFIGALVGIAARDGLLTIDQKLLDFYPEYVTPLMDPRKQDITLRHLLRMLSGFWDIDRMYSSTRIKYAIEHIPLYNDPGKAWHYSTIGVHLLSGIITRVSGMSTLEFARLHLYNPLGITPGPWSRDPQGIYTGGFGMEFTPRDMARFGYLYLQNGSLNGQQIIPKDYLQSSWIPSETSLDSLGYYDAIEESGYGYLWWMAKMGGYWTYLARGHGGQHIVVIPDLDMIIVLTGQVFTTAAFHHVAEFRLSAYLILFPIQDWLSNPLHAPANASGIKRINRSLSHKEYINEITWGSTSRNQGLDITEYRIYAVYSTSNRVLIGTTDANTFSFLEEGSTVTEKSEHIYGITAVTSDQKESIPAFVIIYEPEEGESR